MLPFAPGGDLFSLLHSQRKRKMKLKREDIKAYTYQIIKIFLFLHSIEVKTKVNIGPY